MIWAIIELYLSIENKTIYADRDYKDYALQLLGKANAGLF